MASLYLPKGMLFQNAEFSFIFAVDERCLMERKRDLHLKTVQEYHIGVNAKWYVSGELLD